MTSYNALDTNKKILVTGAAGFIGFHLSKSLLEKGVEVVGYDNINEYYDVNLKYASLEILDTPVYEECGNDEWSATFVTDNEFSDKDEFYMTLIGEDKLLIKHIYIIDHYDESMGMSYAFYDRK